MAAPVPDIQRRRSRPRQRISKDLRDKATSRVIDFFREDEDARADDQEKRLERYAKIRGWVGEDLGDPWPGSSDVPWPDIAKAVEAPQDTIVNAALATRPTMNAKSTSDNGQESERVLSQLLDSQFYEEQPGEIVLHELAQTYTEDGSYVAFVPWVKEWREVFDRQLFPPLPDAEVPRRVFAAVSSVWQVAILVEVDVLDHRFAGHDGLFENRPLRGIGRERLALLDTQWAKHVVHDAIAFMNWFGLNRLIQHLPEIHAAWVLGVVALLGKYRALSTHVGAIETFESDLFQVLLPFFGCLCHQT